MTEQWWVIYGGKNRQNGILDEQDRLVASVGSKERGGDEGKNADAALIAASPELLQTLSDLIAVVETYDDAWNPDTALWDARRLASEVERKARGMEQ